MLISTGFYVITVYINHKWGDLLTYARFTVGLPPGPRAARWFPCQTSSRIFSGKHTIYHGTSWQFQPNHIQLHLFNCISQISWWHIVVVYCTPTFVCGYRRYPWLSNRICVQIIFLAVSVRTSHCQAEMLCNNMWRPGWHYLHPNISKSKQNIDL